MNFLKTSSILLFKMRLYSKKSKENIHLFLLQNFNKMVCNVYVWINKNVTRSCYRISKINKEKNMNCRVTNCFYYQICKLRLLWINRILSNSFYSFRRVLTVQRIDISRGCLQVKFASWNWSARRCRWSHLFSSRKIRRSCGRGSRSRDLQTMANR